MINVIIMLLAEYLISIIYSNLIVIILRKYKVFKNITKLDMTIISFFFKRVHYIVTFIQTNKQYNL